MVIFKGLQEKKRGKTWKWRFLSSVVALFLNNKQSIVLFFLSFFFPDGVSVDSILVIFYLSFLPRSLPPPRYSQSAVCALACVITALPHWRLLLLHACVSVRACVCRCNSVA